MKTCEIYVVRSGRECGKHATHHVKDGYDPRGINMCDEHVKPYYVKKYKHVRVTRI